MPPERGYIAASSAMVSAPTSATSAPTSQMSAMAPTVPTRSATPFSPPITRKIPLPMVEPTSTAAALHTPRLRGRRSVKEVGSSAGGRAAVSLMAGVARGVAGWPAAGRKIRRPRRRPQRRADWRAREAVANFGAARAECAAYRSSPSQPLMTRILRPLLLASAAGTLLLADRAGAQGQLSLDRIFASTDFRLESYPSVQWMRDGERFTYVNDDGDLVVVQAASGTTQVLVDQDALLPAGAAEAIEIEDYQWSQDERKLLVYTNTQRVWRSNTKGQYYVWDVAGRTLTPVSSRPGWQQFAKFSPDGTRVGFVRDNDLYVTDLASGAETRLTRDGSEAIINGTFDWVYEEELGLQ